MAAFDDLVEAYNRLYSVEQIRAALQQALEDNASGVTVTQVSYESGGTVGQVTGKPSELIPVLNAVLDLKEGKDPSASVAHWDYSKVRTGT